MFGWTLNYVYQVAYHFLNYGHFYATIFPEAYVFTQMTLSTTFAAVGVA